MAGHLDRINQKSQPLCIDTLPNLFGRFSGNASLKPVR